MTLKQLSLVATTLAAAYLNLALAKEEMISPGDYKVFEIDFDLAADERFHDVFVNFEPQLRDMLDYWWNQFYSDKERAWFRSNIDELKQAQPDAYSTNLALADFLGLEVAQTFAVSSITEVSTYCTSIVARNSEDQIAHVRNLDFKYTDVMKQLVYEAHLIKDGKVVAISPSIAGFYGAFTGQKPGAFSISYNARERDAGPTPEIIINNLQNNLDSARTPEGAAILYAFLYLDSFDQAVSYLESTKMTSPGHFAIGGTHANQGVILSRDIDGTDHKFELTDQDWFIAMTNVDVWETQDTRYENAVRLMTQLGQDSVEPDGQSIIENVLWDEGVIQADSIFTSAISAHQGTNVAIYDAPN